ncbi:MULTISPECIES: 2-isopropylmalate synthase [Sorangium]|uniref:2-isopropylmalate synthase n=1 Tax=Sorangium cellulosum (strain So ce56) TaxID=448385 RepID=A9GW82_SORC5|nr:2-isopropylmalate synthase [Sorangium cellulosum]CAN93893.1 2-isopropylmalate synthase [Sorangium cellulosum So ce56]
MPEMIANQAMPPSDYVRIFDTTLRDGEQSPGATMTSSEKLEIALALAKLGVDVIETGFPAASPDDLLAVQTIAERVGAAAVPGRPAPTPPIICALARATKVDIDKAWEGVARAAHPRIHTFLATSDIHLKHKLRMTRAEVLDRVRAMVAYARDLCADVEFSPEDAGRSEPEFLYQVLEAAIAAGATTLNIPDTVGYTIPSEFGALIAGIRKNVAGIDRAIVSVHCHNDLGLATANALEGIRAGARQAEVTINGIGERAGNTALEEIVMALATRRAVFGLRTGIDTTQIATVSRLVSAATGFNVQPNKAIVGANAFAHESGIHQDGMLKHQETYEIMRPEMVGVTQTRLVLGKHSGRHALRNRLEELGYHLDEAQLAAAFASFKALADKKKHVTDPDIEAIVSTTRAQADDLYTLDALQVACGTTGMPTATVRLRGPDGALHVRAAIGTGPVDAAYRAIDEIVRVPSSLLEFSVHAVTEGIDALGEVSVRVRADATSSKRHPQHDAAARVFHGHGADTDILVASAKAYLTALNRLLATYGVEPKDDAAASESNQSGHGAAVETAR